MILRLLRGWALLGVFVFDVVRSGFSTAWLIIKPGSLPTPGLVRIAFEGLSPWGASLLGAMVTLTPGTTALEIDYQRREILLHMLDTSRAAETVCDIRRRFERPLRQIYPEEGQR